MIQPDVTSAALYARASVEDHAGRDMQLRGLRELATKRGLFVPPDAEYVDAGHSGASLNRPALGRLRQAVQGGRYDVVLVFTLDRLARDETSAGILRREFKQAGARVECV